MNNIHLLITAVCMTVIVIVSLCVGFLCYIYFMQRQHEYGLLWAIGYTRQQVINRAFAEIGLMNGFGFTVGITISLIVGWIMKTAFYQTFGEVLTLLNPDSLFISACLPICSTFFSLVPIWRLLKKTDPVHIMETL